MPSERQHRLRWQCRRGMLELDLLLADFLDHGHAHLSGDEQATFARLLGCQDQQLHDWLISQIAPPDPAMRALVRRISAARDETEDALF